MPLSDPHPLYERPPLVEAVIGFRLSRSGGWDSILFGRLLDRFEGYEFLDTLASHVVQFDPSKVVTVGSGPETKRFRSTDGGRIVLCGPENLSVSFQPRQMPGGYPGGEVLRSEAMRLFEVYREVTAPAAVTQIGVRYVNNVALPHTGWRVGDYVHNDGHLVPRSVLDSGKPALVRTEMLVDEAAAWDDREAVTVAAVRPPGSAATAVLVVDIDETRTARQLPGTLDADVEQTCATLQQRVYGRFTRIFRPDLYDQFGPRAGLAGSRHLQDASR